MRTELIGANTSCLPNRSLNEAVDGLYRLGFRRITLLGYARARSPVGELAGFWFHDLSDSERQELKALLDPFDAVAIHAPFADLPLFSYDPQVGRLSLNRVRETIDAATYLKAQVVIVHANRRENFPVQLYWDEMVTTFRSLGDYAAERGVRVGLETGYPNSVDLFVDLLEAIGHPSVGATIDTGHTIQYVERDLWGTPRGVALLNERLLDITQQLGPLTIHCHLHDVRSSDWRDHRALGRGVLDFPSFLAELRSTGFSGVLELELSEEDFETALKESKSRLESMLRELSRRRRAA